MTPDKIEEIAKLMVGEHVGWQARFADAAGISRSHLSNILKGSRPVTTDFQIRIYVACNEHAAMLDRRSKDLANAAAELRRHLPPDVVRSPGNYSRKRYDAEAVEAEGIIKDMTGWSDKGDQNGE